MKLATGNPQHLVEAVFATNSSTNQSMLVEFFDPLGNEISEQFVFR